MNSKKYKIFFIMSTNDYSGAEVVNFNIISELKDKFDFYWVSRRGKINEYLNLNNIKWIEIQKLSVSEIKRVVREYDPDLLHATDYNSSFITSIAVKNKPIIAHIHNNALWIRKINLKSLAFLLTAIRVDKIITVSQSIKNEYIFSRMIADKILCLYNPVSYKKVNSLVNKKKQKKLYDICCCARISEPKDPIRFLNVISKIKKTIPNIKTIWIGDGELVEIALKRRKELGLDNNVEFIGRKRNPYQYIYQSRIFLLTSKWEGFGLAAFEALALGIPAIVTNVGGLPYIVDESCGAVCKTDLELVSSSIKLLTNERIYKEYSIHALQKAKQIDNYSSYMKELCSIYLELIRKAE